MATDPYRKVSACGNRRSLAERRTGLDLQDYDMHAAGGSAVRRTQELVSSEK